MVKQYEVEITNCSHDTDKSVGYAEDKINDREFTAFRATREPPGGLFLDSWRHHAGPKQGYRKSIVLY